MPSSVTHLRAIALAIAGYTCWVLCDSVIKLAGRSALPGYEIVGFLGLFMAGIMAIYAGLHGELRELWPRRLQRLFVRGLLDVGNNLCVVVALRHLSLTLFYILVFTSPLMVATLGRLFLKEAMDWRKVLAILTGFLGVVIAVYPARSAGSNAVIGVGACVVCVTCFSIATVWARVISQAERAESMTFFSGLVSAAVGLCPMLVHAVPVSGQLLAALVATGLLGAIGNICMFTALKHTTAATVSQYHYSQLVSGSVVAWLLFQEKPTIWTLAGAGLIVAAGLYIAIRASNGRETPPQLTEASLMDEAISEQ